MINQIKQKYHSMNDLLRKVSRFLLKKVFTKKSIVFVTDKKITTINLGIWSQLACVAFVIYSASFVSQAIRSNVIIEGKDQEIYRLSILNGYYKDQFEDINGKLKKVDEYLSLVGKDKSSKDSFSSIFRHPRIVNEQTQAKFEKQILDNIEDSRGVLATIKDRINNRIGNIETAVVKTGLNLSKFALSENKKSEEKNTIQLSEISLNSNLEKAQGGPLVDEENPDGNLQFSSVIDQSEFTNEIDYLIALEKLSQVMPFSKPMKNYYISSGFGKRIDPINGSVARHMGLDFVGQKEAKVLSPSEGKVIFAGRFMSYGNAVVIDHGFGITTRYGHLSKIKVKKDDMVAKGDVLGLQGSTGRSTGAHLHYEVRYKNQPLNPKNFLQAGDLLFADNTEYKN